MEFPFFYDNTIRPGITRFDLSEETSKHVIQVLRMKESDKLLLTNGNGDLLHTTIDIADRKKCVVRITHSERVPKPEPACTIAISPVKNASRFEWFLEKATEIGVNEIIPLICDRTEKKHFRESRLTGILISAIQQSKQAWLPVLHRATSFQDFIRQSTASQKFIAHCEPGIEKKGLSRYGPFQSAVIVIGPEGDFTSKEITAALQNNFLPVSLGDTRLRTETAGIVAATLFQNI